MARSNVVEPFDRAITLGGFAATGTRTCPSLVDQLRNVLATSPAAWDSHLA
jgi:hypothetical protein